MEKNLIVVIREDGTRPTLGYSPVAMISNEEEVNCGNKRRRQTLSPAGITESISPMSLANESGTELHVVSHFLDESLINLNNGHENEERLRMEFGCSTFVDPGNVGSLPSASFTNQENGVSNVDVRRFLSESWANLNNDQQSDEMPGLEFSRSVCVDSGLEFGCSTFVDPGNVGSLPSASFTNQENGVSNVDVRRFLNESWANLNNDQQSDEMPGLEFGRSVCVDSGLPSDSFTNEDNIVSNVDVKRFLNESWANLNNVEDAEGMPAWEVERILNESWNNLNDGSSGSCSSIPPTECDVYFNKPCRVYENGVPAVVRRNPTSIFPAGERITLPDVPSCWYCKAKKFFLEPSGFCCCAGDIVLKPVVLPPAIVELLTGTSTICKHFRTYIRVYNNNFAYTSMGVKNDKGLASKADCGIYTFRVSGQVHHFLGDLEGLSSSSLGLQLYFYDPENELQNRLSATPNLDEGVMMKLMKAMEQNPYAAFLRSLSRVVDLDRYYISINCSSSLDQRTHNCPTSSDVAAIWIDGDESHGTNKFQRDVRVYTRSGQSYSVREHFSCFDTLQYPLMFPKGEPGWHPNIRKAKYRGKHLADVSERINEAGSYNHYMNDTNEDIQDDIEANESGPTVTPRQYYCYKLQMRADDTSFQLSFGRLFQQFVVDMYIKIETMRLMYIRTHQAKFRVDFYQGIIDSISIGLGEGRKTGKRILLPSSFIGGPRDMRKRYVDAMSLVRRFGKPDIFLTITCNSQWSELKKCVKTYEERQNRPDLATRVFKAKVEIMKKRILIDEVFGEVASLVYVIEYQKRGLPHAHFLIILKPNFKLITPDAYDRVVSAELPLEAKDPVLHELVKNHMFHGPCGHNRKSPCMKDGACKSKYPKEFCDHTLHGKHTYPQYRRRNNGVAGQVLIRGDILDNRWVVPYNPRLLREFDCHMNVEVCCDIRAVKYLYKYIYKGVDKVSMKVISQSEEEVFDEISNFQAARWISPPEALWRIYAFPMSYMQPSVINLQIHLPNFHSVRFSDDDDLEEIAALNSSERTMLSEFFSMNRTDGFARVQELYYRDFPEYFVWNTSRKQWTRRKRGNVIGRIASVNPSEGERYYLRLLLSEVKAPTSYDDLLTVNNRICSTFREFANLRGLLMTDTSFEKTLEEAASYQLPYSLRVLFASILSYCELADPKALYERFYEDLSEDFKWKQSDINLCAEEIERNVLKDLDRTLETLGRSINSFNLSNIHIAKDPSERITKEIEAERSIPVSPEDVASRDLLNEKQREIYDRVMDDALMGRPGVYFVDGPGGTGKTFLYKALLANIRSMGYIAIATASSGIASTLLPGGRTAHSRFKIPIDGSDSTDAKLSKATGSGFLIMEAKLIIWDEAPMLNKKAIECVDTMLRDFCETEEPFGGKVVVLGGDFRQILPVVQSGTRADMIQACLVKSTLWRKLKKFKLTENIRARIDPEFSKYLMRIGDGTEPETPCGKIQIPTAMLIPYTNEKESLQALVDFVYPDLTLFENQAERMSSSVVLTPKNDAVHQINDALIKKFPGEAKVYKSIDRASSNIDEAHYTDFLNEQTPSGLPLHELCLKVNCPVVLLRNLNPAIGFANGTRMICKTLDDNVIGVEIISGQFKGSHGFIPRIKIQPNPGDRYVIPFTRQQFPVRLGFAMTINKGQGQTLDSVGVYLRQPVFSHGQLYVALSRAKTSADVRVLIGPPTANDFPTSFTRNELLREVLQLSAA